MREQHLDLFPQNGFRPAEDSVSRALQPPAPWSVGSGRAEGSANPLGPAFALPASEHVPLLLAPVAPLASH